MTNFYGEVAPSCLSRLVLFQWPFLKEFYDILMWTSTEENVNLRYDNTGTCAAGICDGELCPHRFMMKTLTSHCLECVWRAPNFLILVLIRVVGTIAPHDTCWFWAICYKRGLSFPCLSHIQFVIKALTIHKITVFSLLCHQSVPYHVYLVRILDCRQSMGNNNACSSFSCLVKCFLHNL